MHLALIRWQTIRWTFLSVVPILGKSTFWWRKTARNDKNLGQIFQSSPLAQKLWFVKYPNQITSRKFKRWFTRWSMNIYLHKKILVSAQLTCWPVHWVERARTSLHWYLWVNFCVHAFSGVICWFKYLPFQCHQISSSQILRDTRYTSSDQHFKIWLWKKPCHLEHIIKCSPRTNITFTTTGATRDSGLTVPNTLPPVFTTTTMPLRLPTSPQPHLTKLRTWPLPITVSKIADLFP